MSTRMRRSFSGPARALLPALLLSLACNRGDPPPTVPPADSDATPAATAQSDADPAGTDECPDWSTLDPATLEPIPQTPYTPTLEAVWRTIRDKHYDRTLGCSDWPALRVEFGNKLPEAKDEAAAYALMSEMISRLGQSHMVIVPPRHEVAGEPRAGVKHTGARAPLLIRVLDDEPIVVDPSYGGHKSGIPGGAKVVSIDGDELAPLVKQAKENHERPVEATFAVRRILEGWLGCPEGGKKTIVYQANGSTKTKTRKVACHPITAERVSLGHIKDVPAHVDHRMLKGKELGYLHFNIWMVPLMPKIQAALTEMRGKGMKGLVIDLRGNPGGVGAMVIPFGRLILSESESLGVMRMRDSEQNFAVTAGGDPYTGPIAILVDEGTASTSEIFGQALQDLGRAKVYGSVPSQGAALPSVIEQLPDGGILQFVVADYKSPSGTAVEGKGVVPDVVVPESREDFAKGRDPVLEAAVADLAKL